MDNLETIAKLQKTFLRNYRNSFDYLGRQLKFIAEDRRKAAEKDLIEYFELCQSEKRFPTPKDGLQVLKQYR